jgi:hypothetical protein
MRPYRYGQHAGLEPATEDPDWQRRRVRVLVLTGGDWQNRTAKALADALHGRHAEVPGDHFTAENSTEFWEALTGFLAG